MGTHETIRHLITEVLTGTELRLQVDSYNLTENFETGEVALRCEVHDRRTGEQKTISGQGVGLVDAMFNGIVRLYSDAYPSLKTIRCSDFHIKANVATARVASGTDMTAQVFLRVKNSEGIEFTFEHDSASITRSAVSAVLDAAEFFINSERAFIAVFRALEYARKEARPDSIGHYTEQLTTLVEATSYSEVIEQIRKSELKK